MLGWGVGGIEAEAAMLGQPMSMLIPQVLGFKLTGELPEGATATDLVLTVTEMLRERGVVGKFVEFYGAGLAGLPLADRATIGNMSPEFGSTCAIFPIDAETLRYLEFSGRPAELLELVEAYAREQGLWHDEDSEEPTFSDRIELDLADRGAEHRRAQAPQDRVSLTESKAAFRMALEGLLPDDDRGGRVAGRVASRPPIRSPPTSPTAPATSPPAAPAAPRSPIGASTKHPGNPGRRDRDRARPRPCGDRRDHQLHQHLEPVGDARARASWPATRSRRGCRSSRGSRPRWPRDRRSCTEYLDRAGLTEYLDELGFNLVGYGCTTCIGNSGPLPEEISDVVGAEDLAVVSVLSGNRNFEGRINPDVKMNYLASPPLCVAYALAGTMDIDLYDEPLGEGRDGGPVYLKDIWPDAAEVAQTIEQAVQSDMFRRSYGDVFEGDERWNSLEVPHAATASPGTSDSTYVRKPPFFEDLPREPEPLDGHRATRACWPSSATA